jgi:hypothetical protein
MTKTLFYRPEEGLGLQRTKLQHRHKTEFPYSSLSSPPSNYVPIANWFMYGSRVPVRTPVLTAEIRSGTAGEVQFGAAAIGSMINQKCMEIRFSFNAIGIKSNSLNQFGPELEIPTLTFLLPTILVVYNNANYYTLYR